MTDRPDTTPARHGVVRHLAEQVRRFPDLAIESLTTQGLDGRDAALALAIDHATIRHWITLRTVIEARSTRPWDRLDAHVRACLLAGAAQLLYLDRVPDHAAIDESVRAAKSGPSPRAAGLVNAVLRRVVELRGEAIDRWDPDEPETLPRPDGGAWRLASPILPDDPVARLGRQTSHPAALLAAWVTAFGFDGARRLAHHDLIQAPMIVTGVGPDPGSAVTLRPHRESGYHLLEGGRDAFLRLLDEHPGARVQDPAAAAAIAATAGLSPSLVVDACAGRGTKTRQLAELHPASEIVATDVHTVRREELRRTFRDEPRVAVVEPRDLAAYRGRADLLVLDVPCTNTGVLARRLEARYRFDRANLRSLVELQRQVVADTLPLTHERSHLLYATCSLERSEDEDQVGHLTEALPLVGAADARRDPRGVPGDDPAGYSDGSYWALLERR